MKNTFKTLQAIRTVAIIAIVAAMAFSIMSCATFKIVSVEWDTLEGPSRARQFIAIGTSEVKVFANYENGDRRQASAGSLSYERNRAGVQTVTATISGQGTGTFRTEVMELTGIRVSTPPTKTTYTVGERFDTAGIKLTGTWRNMPDMEIPTSQMLSVTQTGFDSSTAGNKVVTITWNGRTATVNVTVTAAAAAAPAAAAATTPSTQQPSAFNPAPNQPSPVGTWRNTLPNGYRQYTFNANGTCTFTMYATSTRETFNTSYTWSASGNMIKLIHEGGGEQDILYEISGNTLTMRGEPFTRQ